MRTRTTMNKLLLRTLLSSSVCAISVACGPHLYAQTDTARIQGTTIDATGAFVPNAKIELTNLDTGAVRSEVSTANGSFTFPALQPGRYKATVMADGFKSVVQNFALEVSQVQALTFKLNPGAVTSSIDVTDAAPLVDTATSSLGTVIEGRQVTELPLNGRNFTQLALLVPGVTRGVYGSSAQGTGGNAETNRYSDTGGAALQVNGLPPQANNFELDGLDNNDAKVNTIVVFPPVEATRQFRVTTSVPQAEFGQAGGAVVQSSIKSGTNNIHGSAFVFDRDQIFDASPNYFAPTQPNPVFHRTQFGGTLGIPLWKNHLFLFGDYQGLRLKQPLGTTYATVATPLMRTGDFSELLSATSNITTSTPDQTITGCKTAPGPKGTIYDPTTCLAFPSNKIPATRLNQAALNYLNAFPLPNNGPAQGNTTLLNNYYANPVQTQRYDDFDVRMDWNATQKDAFFARFSYGQDVLAKSSLFTNLPAGFAAGSNPTHPRSQGYGYTHIFSANLVNEFRYGHLYDFYGYINPLNNIPVSANLGIANANRNAQLGGGAAINGGSTLVYTGDGGQYTIPQGYDQFVDEVSYTRGRHSFKVGGSFEKRNVSYFQGNSAKGLFDFSAASFTGTPVADMLGAFVNNYQLGVASTYFRLHQSRTGLFIQDDWKASNRLTLNLGVRYDIFTAPYEDNNYLSNFDLGTLTLQQAGTNGLSRGIINTNLTNVAPRVGFAYDLNGDSKTILRGGYGLFYYTLLPNLTFNPDYNGVLVYSANPINGGYRINFSGQAPVNDNNNLHATAALPLPIFGQAVNRANPLNAGLLSTVINRANPQIQQFNLQMQRQMTSSSSLTIAYVGTTTRHQAQTYNIDAQPLNTAPNTKLYPQFGSITRTLANGNSSYNGLQIFLNSRLSHGVTYTAAYTWSHLIDNAGGASMLQGFVPSFAINRGTSASDQRHVFSFSALAELPVGRGKLIGGHMPRPVDAVLGGWQLNSVVFLQSGTPFDVTTSRYFYNSGTTTAAPSATITERADVIAPVRYVKTVHEWFDTSSFARPPVVNANGQTSVFTRQGTFSRNQLVGPSYRNMDLSIFKHFPIYKELNAEFRAEAYNLTNTPHFTNPNGSLDSCIYPSGATPTYTCASSPTGSLTTNDFGQITATRVHSERQLQLAFRLQF